VRESALNGLSGPILARRTIRVAMREVDQAGVIYFPVAYEWHEGLFTSWMAVIGQPISRLLPRGMATATVASRANYLRPLRMDDVVELELTAGKAGSSSFVLHTAGRKRGESQIAIDVESTHVWTALTVEGIDKPRELSAQPLPEWLREAFAHQVDEPPVV